MAKKVEQKQETRGRMLEAVHKGFRQRGFDGAGVDGLAKSAGVTSGAFYAHFGSKAAAFREAVATGVGEFDAAVLQFQAEYGDLWLDEFAHFYLGRKRKCELGDSCALQSLTPEVTRADDETRATFQAALLEAAKSFAAGMPGKNSKSDRESTWANIALLIGGATLARAVKDPKLADEIALAVEYAVSGLSGSGE